MANEYQVIARKWRPQRFADMVGQEHIVATLKNAIRQQRTAHAYLFVGSRGIGKTTTARIFAKAMNCEAPEDGEPCCKCNSCVSIANESNIDVIEIDAASQNSVENIRELRDEVMHVPVSSRYKIYIIDEVHMLSKQAWNALLKTVEEPPKHAKFIFATTEVHMVLPTIISRCQRFDLQRISTRQIAERLMLIAEKENVKISISAVEAIARAADGGMRDAQSLLDQMIAFFGSGSDSEISEEQVLSLFGLTAASETENLVKAIFANNKGEVVAHIHTLAAQGKNLETLYSDLLEFLRGVELCQLLANPENVLECGTETVAMYQEMAKSVRQDVVQRLLETLSPVGRTLHDALNKQVYIETIILKSMRVAHSLQIDDLIGRLNQVRNGGELDDIANIPPVVRSTTPQVVVPTIEKTIMQAPAAPPSTPVETPIQPQTTLTSQPQAQPAAQTPTPVETQVQAQVTPAPQPTIQTVAQTPTPVEVHQTQPTHQEPQKSEIQSEPSPTPLEPVNEVVEEEKVPEPEETPKAPPVTIEKKTSPEPNTENAPPFEPDNQPEIIDSKPEIDIKDIYDPEVKTPIPEVVMEEETIEEIEAAEELMPEQEEDEEETISSVPQQQLPQDQMTPQGIWHAIIKRTETDNSFNPVMRNFMKEATPTEYSNSILRVVFDGEFDPAHGEELKTILPKLDKLMMDVTADWSCRINIEMTKELLGPPVAAPETENTSKEMPEDLQKKIEANPFVQGVIDLFGGEVVDVHG